MALSLGALFIFLFFFNVSTKVCVCVRGNVRFFNILENMRDVWGDRSICSSKGLVLCDFSFFFFSFACVRLTASNPPKFLGRRCFRNRRWREIDVVISRPSQECGFSPRRWIPRGFYPAPFCRRWFLGPAKPLSPVSIHYLRAPSCFPCLPCCTHMGLVWCKGSRMGPLKAAWPCRAFIKQGEPLVGGRGRHLE